MPKDNRLKERAGPPEAWQDLFWHVDSGVALFAGPLGRNALHRHSVPVYLGGLYDTFRLRIEGTKWFSCRAAIVPAGVAYEFDMHGDPLSVLYLEPSLAGVNALVPLLRTHEEARGALIGMQGEVRSLRAIYEERACQESNSNALRDLTGFGIKRARASLDPRISHAVAQLSDNSRELEPVETVARTVGLSASRFQHLFTEQVGVPFRRYRIWHRMRSAIREVSRGSNFIDAAHAAGFADQAHFSREFRKTFGAAPTLFRAGV